MPSLLRHLTAVFEPSIVSRCETCAIESTRTGGVSATKRRRPGGAYRGEIRERPAVGDLNIVGRQRRSEANKHRASCHLKAAAREVDVLQVKPTAERHVKVTRYPLGVDRGAVAADDCDVGAMHGQQGAAEVEARALRQVDSDLSVA
eukprot:496926-Prymnesium_polylepis.4